MGACCGAAENKSRSTPSPNKGAGPTGLGDFNILEVKTCDIDAEANSPLLNQTKSDAAK